MIKRMLSRLAKKVFGPRIAKALKGERYLDGFQLNLTDDQVHELNASKTAYVRRDGTDYVYCAKNPDTAPGLTQPCPSGKLWWEQPGSNLVDCCNYSPTSGCQGGHCVGRTSTPIYQGHQCLTLIPERDCPILADKVKAIRADPLSLSSYDGHCYRCVYDAAQIAAGGCETIDAWHQERINEQDRLVTTPSCVPTGYSSGLWDKEIMQSFCASRAEPGECPTISSTYKPDGVVKCANMMACQACKNWAVGDDEAGKEAASDVMSNWCTSNTDTSSNANAIDVTKSDPTCLCINATYDQSYLDLQTFIQEQPGCWWKRCADRFTMTEHMSPLSYREEDCPSIICANIYNMSGGVIEADEITNNVNCSGSVETSTTVCTTTCGAHGTCVGSTCRCETGWGGSDCTIQSTDPDTGCTLNCGIHGHCNDSGSSCTCDSGWTGTLCGKAEEGGGTTTVDPLKAALAIGGIVLLVGGGIAIVAYGLSLGEKKTVV